MSLEDDVEISDAESPNDGDNDEELNETEDAHENEQTSDTELDNIRETLSDDSDKIKVTNNCTTVFMICC